MEFYVKPWAHQMAAIEKAGDRDSLALLFEMGTGKTSTAINIYRQKCLKEKAALRALVLCPLIVIENWKREFQIHSRLPASFIVPLKGSKKDRERQIDVNGWKNDCIQAKIFVTNFEALQMDSVFLKLSQWRPEFLIVDESHKCKDPQTKRTKAVIRLADNADYRLILTGTPILNSAMDLYAQYRILDRGDTFGRNYFSFRARYFVDKNTNMSRHSYFPKWEVRAGSLEEMHENIKESSVRVEKSQCLDLPPLLKQTIYVPLSATQRKHYEEMKRDFITFIKGDACVAQLAITKALRLLQITSGFMNVEAAEGKFESVDISDNKRKEALSELLQDITTHSKCIVWAVFKQNYEAIRGVCLDLDIDFVEVHGGISPNLKQENVDRFNTDPKCKVLIGHPGSGGIGINLVAASYSIFYSRSFSLEQDLQAEARNYRGGSEIHAKITRIDLVAPDTIDELVLKRLASKLEIGEKVLREMADQL